MLLCTLTASKFLSCITVTCEEAREGNYCFEAGAGHAWHIGEPFYENKQFIIYKFYTATVHVNFDNTVWEW